MSYIDDLGISTEQARALKNELENFYDKDMAEEHLTDFVKQAWHILEPSTELIWNWHLDTLCAYLEAVYYGKIQYLIINIPPGTMKSLIVSVFYPAWVWTSDPGYKFYCGSNDGPLATRDSLKMRQVVESDWYQGNWGDDWQLSKEQAEKTLFANSKRGHRQSQGIMGRATGKRGNCVILDDPHDAGETESAVTREAIIKKYDSSWSSRRNNLDTDPVILIMQRLHELDLTGHFINMGFWTVLAIPMRYDNTVVYDAGKDIGRPDLNDPRSEEGELLFPARFSERSVKILEMHLGEYGSAGQLQQRPAPKGGGEFPTKWLNHYIAAPLSGNIYILVDPAGEKKKGADGKKKDNTAMGVFLFASDQNIYLLDGVRSKMGLIERTTLLFRWVAKYKQIMVVYERYGMQSDIVHIKDKMKHNRRYFKIEECGGSLNKNDRIRQLKSLFAQGRLWLPEYLHKSIDGKTVDIIEEFIENEYNNFPVASRDDFFDMMARLCDEDIDYQYPDPDPPPLDDYEAYENPMP